MNDVPLANVPEHAKVAIRIVSGVSGSKSRTFTGIFRSRDDGQRALDRLTRAAARAGRDVEIFVVASWADETSIHERRWQINSDRMGLPAARDWPFTSSPALLTWAPADQPELTVR